MKTEKNGAKTKTINRKSVSQAIAKQDVELKKTSSSEAIQEAIRLKAYELYVERDYTPGDATEDWLIAERIILEGSR